MDVGESAEIFKPMHDAGHVARELDRVEPTTVHLSDCDLPAFLDIAARFGTDTYGYVVTPNVDHLIRYCDDVAFRDLYRSARYTLLDSRFLALLLQFVTGARLPTCPGSDLTAELFGQVIKPDDPVLLVGCTARQVEILRQRYGLKNLVHYDPPMGFISNPKEVEATLQFIEKQSPFRFCLLAVGCPQQEMVATALKSRGIARGLALCVGASVNFITGGERRAPRWMGDLGIEWMFRLMQSPVRLAGRYLLRGPRIFFLLPRMKFQLRSPDIDHG